MSDKETEIQRTNALLELIKSEAMYTYNFEGKRYDVGDKLEFSGLSVECVLRKSELKYEFIECLRSVT